MENPVLSNLQNPINSELKPDNAIPDSMLQKPTQPSLISKKRLIILLIIFVFLLITAPMVFIYFENRERIRLNAEYLANLPFPTMSPFMSPVEIKYKSPTPIPTPLPSYTPDAKTLTELPSLYNELEWKKLTPENSRFKDHDMIYYYSQDGKSFGMIPYGRLSGNEWYATKVSPQSDPPVMLSQRFNKYYQNEFSKIGWAFRIETPQFEINAPAGGYPLGDIWGYIGKKDDQIKLIVFEEQREQAQQCPCVSHFWVYISNVIEAEQIPYLVNYE